MKFRNIVFLGKSGAGKGTQLNLLKQYFTEQGKTVLHIYTGELLRALAEVDSFAGKKIKYTIENGLLAPEWIAIYLWQKDLMTRVLNNEEIFMFEGSPRKFKEAEMLDTTLEWFDRKNDTVAVLLDVGHGEVSQRLKTRGRTDDTDDAIKNRLDWFDTEVMPVIRYYEASKRLITINGEGDVDEIQKRIRNTLGLAQ